MGCVPLPASKMTSKVPFLLTLGLQLTLLATATEIWSSFPKEDTFPQQFPETRTMHHPSVFQQQQQRMYPGPELFDHPMSFPGPDPYQPRHPISFQPHGPGLEGVGPFQHVIPFASMGNGGSSPSQLPRFLLFPLRSPRIRWYEGPNVCTETQEIDEGQSSEKDMDRFLSYHSSSCSETDMSLVCTTQVQSYGLRKKYVQTFRCCHGYQKTPTTNICEQVDLQPIFGTLKAVGGSAFADLTTFVGLEGKLAHENLTVLCPTDEALQDYRATFEDNAISVDHAESPQQPSIINGDRSLKSLVLSHLLTGYLFMSDFYDEQAYSTLEGSMPLRTQVYRTPERVVTVNCVRILTSNHIATNGVVHLVERVIPTTTRTLDDVLSSDPRFTMFYRLLTNAHMIDLLQSPNKHSTILAPTDDAFRRLDQHQLHTMLGGQGCVNEILQYHILPKVICSSALPPLAHSVTKLGRDVHLRHDEEEDKMFVNDIQVADKDLLAANGVVHVLDEVLIPEEAESITKILDEYQLKDVITLLEEANLRQTLDTMENVTFFAPTNQAIKDAEPMLRALQKSPGKLRDVILYHIGSPMTRICTVENNERIGTRHGSSTMRFNMFTGPLGLSHQVTVQCARILEMDRQACGASVQLIEKVLFPPEGHLIDVLASNTSFSIMRRLLRQSHLENELLAHGPYTVLAPTDNAFYRLPEEELQRILQDKEAAEQVVKNHVLPEILCCTGIQHTTWLYHAFTRTLSGAQLPLQRQNHVIHVGGAQLLACDFMADNGVVHAIDRVISPQGSHRPMQRRRPQPKRRRQQHA